MKMKLMIGAVVGLVLVGGIAFGMLLSGPIQSVKADEAKNKEGYWEIQSGGSGNEFYVIKHNRLTGETYVLSVYGKPDDKRWLKLPEETIPEKKK